MRVSKAVKRSVLRIIGLCVCIFPTVAAICSYFPIWVERNDASVISGGVLLLLAIAIVPLLKYLKDKLRTPSAPVMWLISFVLFFLLSRIADEMTVISLVGFLSNTVGSFIFKLSDRCSYAAEDKKNEAEL